MQDAGYRMVARVFSFAGILKGWRGRFWIGNLGRLGNLGLFKSQ